MDLLNIVTQRVDVTQNELKGMREELGSLDSRIRNEVNQLGKRPRYTQEELDRNLKASEHQHAHSSLSNKEERALMKEMETYKKDMKALIEFTARQSKVDEMKEERSRLQESLKQDMKKLNELQFYARKLKLAADHQVDFSEILDVTMTFAEDRLGAVIGKNGNTLDKLENTFKVCIDADRTIPGVRIMGLTASIESAQNAISEIVNTMSEEISLSDVVISTLITIMTDKSGTSITPIQELLATQSVRLDVSKSKGLCKITGHTAQIDAMRSAIESLECSRRVLTIDVAVIPHIIGKGGSTVNQLGDEHNVQIDVEKEKGTITVTGLAVNVTTASEAILALHEERREVEEDIPLQRSILMNALVGPSGNMFKELSKTLNVRLSFDKAESESIGPDILHIKGPTAQVTSAKAHINELVNTYMSQTINLTVPLDVIPSIVGKKGANMKALRATYQEAHIDVEEGGKVSIHAPSTLIREQVRNAIEKFVQSNYQETIPYEADAMVALKSTRGKETCKFIQDLAIMMDLDDTVTPPSIRLKGEKENVNTAITVLKEFLASNQHWITPCSEDEMVSLVNGGDNSLKKKLESEYGVEVYFNKKESWLRIRGSAQNIENAKEHWHSALRGDLSFNSYMLDLGNVNMNVLIGKGGQNIRKMEESNPDVVFDLLKASNQIRIRGPLNNISKAKWDVLSAVDSLKSYSIMEIPSDCQNLSSLRSLFTTVGAVCNVELKLEDDSNTSKKKGKDSKDGKGDNKEIKESSKPPSPPTEVTIRGDLSAIESAKQKLQEAFTGISIRKIPFFVADPALVTSMSTVITSLVNKYGLNDSKKGKSGSYYLVHDTDDHCLELCSSVHKCDEICMALYNHLSTHLAQYYLVNHVPKKFLREMKQFSLIEEISEKCDCLTYVDRNNGIIVITAKPDNTHSRAALKRAHSIIEERESAFKASQRTIPIEEYMIVLLVGKQGASITALQKETNVQIQVNRSALQLELNCSDISTLETAVQIVTKRVEALKSEYWTIKIDKQIAGQIIGKGGSHVKKLREATGAMISIDANTNIIEVTGSADKVKAARAAIEDIIAVEKINNEGVFIRIPVAAQALIIGAKGSMVKEIESKSGCRMDLDRNNNIIKLKGTASSKDSGKAIILSLLKDAEYEENMYGVVTEAEAYSSSINSRDNASNHQGKDEVNDHDDDSEKVSATTDTGISPMKNQPAYQLSKSALKRQRQREKREKGQIAASKDSNGAITTAPSAMTTQKHTDMHPDVTNGDTPSSLGLNNLSIANTIQNSHIDDDIVEPYISSAERRALEHTHKKVTKPQVEDNKTQTAKTTSGAISNTTTTSKSSTSKDVKVANQPTKRDIAKNLINTGMDGQTIANACQNFPWTLGKTALVAALIEDGCNPELANDIAEHSNLSSITPVNPSSNGKAVTSTGNSNPPQVQRVAAARTGGVAESKSTKTIDTSGLSHQSSTDDILDLLASIGGNAGSAPRSTYRSSTGVPSASTGNGVTPNPSGAIDTNGSSTSKSNASRSTTVSSNNSTANAAAPVKPKGAPTATKKAWGK